MGLTRRGALVAAAGAAAAIGGGGALVWGGALPGGPRLRSALGACDVGGSAPRIEPVPHRIGTFRSASRRREVGYAVVAPRAASDLPICLYLHGRGGSHADVAGPGVGLPWHLAALIADGAAPFALVGVDGDETYWHRRADGDDPQAMITDEVLPRLAREGYRTDVVGLLGVSMGGYGALLLGGRLGSERVAAIGAISPALWQEAGETTDGAFDSAQDFAANDVFDAREALSAIPTRLDCGRDDPFVEATRAYLAGAPPSVIGAVTAGCHDGDFWRSVAGAHLARIGAALTA